jgi:hypothetical protein
MQLIREVKTPPIPKRNHNVSKFTVLATVKFVAGAREQLLDMLSAHRTRCLAEEPGTLTFEILVPVSKRAPSSSMRNTPTKRHSRRT